MLIITTVFLVPSDTLNDLLLECDSGCFWLQCCSQYFSKATESKSSFLDQFEKTWEHHLLHVKGDNVIIPLPSAIEGWLDDQKKWLQIKHTVIFLDSLAVDF